MAESIKPVHGVPSVAASNVTFYTAPSGVEDALMMNIRACNTTAGSVLVRIFKVQNGGAASASNAIVYDTSLSAGDTLTIEKEALAPDDFLVVYADQVGVTFIGSVLERTP